MDFFEVLIVVAFILVPLLEGIFKQRGKKGGEEPIPRPAPRERERVEARTGAGPGGLAGSESQAGTGGADGAAADMVPADLWEMLTGEKRPAPPGEPAPWETGGGPAWESPSEEFPEEIGGTEEAALEETQIVAPWEEWRTTEIEREPRPQPLSLEYEGPEAYSLETLPAAPEVRHRRFHEKYDSPLDVPPVHTPSAVFGELRSGLQGDGLRRSVLLAEILGPPKGLS